LPFCRSVNTIRQDEQKWPENVRKSVMTRSTLAKLRTLEKLCEAGYADEVLERSLEKLLAHQQMQLQMHLQALEKDLPTPCWTNA